MATVFDVLVQAARNIDALEEGVAQAGGSTTTLVDATLIDEGWTDDSAFNAGTLFIMQHAGGTAPQGQSRVPTGYLGATGVITVAPAFSVAPAAGDIYGVTTARYPRNIMVGKLNEFLAELGDIPSTDTSITTLAGVTDYTLPVGLKKDLRQVWIARQTASPYLWSRLTTYHMGLSNPGVADILQFDYFLPAGYKLKLVYMAAHPAVYADTDLLSDYIALDWAALEAAAKTARWRLDQPGEDRTALIDKINDLTQQAERAEHRRRPVTPAPTPRLPYLPGV